MLLHRALLRELARGKWSLLAALVGLSVAVASVTAVHLLNSRVALNLDQLQPLGLAAHLARRDDGADILIQDYGALTEKLARGELEEISALIPLIEGTSRDGWRILGVDWVALRTTRNQSASPSPRLEVEITDLLTTPSVLVSETLGAQEKVRVDGQSLRVLGAHSTGDDQLLLADIATASELLEQTEISALALIEKTARVSRVDLLDRLFVGLGAIDSRNLSQDILGLGYIVSAPDEEFPIRRFVSAVMFNLGVLSVLCLLVAGFIAFQSSAGTVQRRAPLMERFASMGASSGRLRRLVYGESAAVGLIACAVGIPLGIATANLAIQMGDLRANQALQLDFWLVSKAIVLGVGVSLLGTALAQRRIGAPGKFMRLPWLKLLIGPALVALGLTAGLLGAFLMLGGLFLFSVQLAWLMLGWISRLPLKQMGIRRRDVIRGAGNQARKLFPVVSAFILALSVALAMQLMVSSLKDDFDLFLDQRLDGELSLEGGSRGFSPDDVVRLASLPGVRHARAVETATARIGRHRVQVRIIAYSPSELARYGAPPNTGKDNVLINGQLSRELNNSGNVTLSTRFAPFRSASSENWILGTSITGPQDLGFPSLSITTPSSHSMTTPGALAKFTPLDMRPDS